MYMIYVYTHIIYLLILPISCTNLKNVLDSDPGEISHLFAFFFFCLLLRMTNFHRLNDLNINMTLKYIT